jgi:hypothetical protein
MIFLFITDYYSMASTKTPIDPINQKTLRFKTRSPQLNDILYYNSKIKSIAFFK